MRRPALVILVILAVLAAGSIPAKLLLEERHREQTLATVGDRQIKREQLEEAVRELTRELRAEGREVPERGTDGWRRIESQTLASLVDHAGIEQAARALGVVVTSESVKARFERDGGAEAKAELAGEEEKQGEEPPVLAAVRTQLVLERVADVLARDIVVTGAEVKDARRPGVDERTIRAELEHARRAEALRTWLDQARKDTARRATYSNS